MTPPARRRTLLGILATLWLLLINILFYAALAVTYLPALRRP